MEKRSYGLYTAISVVIANMIGVGVFTSLGFQVVDLGEGFTFVMLWALGGFASLLGALAYSEVGAALPNSGGEYNYLSKIYHPAVGFLAGWISILVGFAAPIAAAAIGFSKYLSNSIDLKNSLPFLENFPFETIIAILVVMIITMFHLFKKKVGAAFQNIFTTFKILIILFLIIAGFLYGTEDISFIPNNTSFKEMMSPAFVLSLYFVMYSYSGWNAAAYFAGEIKEPSKNIPRSLFVGTLFVSTLYVLLNVVFLKTVPISELSGQLEVGYLFANKLWGSEFGAVMGLIISFLLVSSISSMVLVGPRVSNEIGEDFKFFNLLAKKNKEGIPVIAMLLQFSFSAIYIITATFDQVITFIGFTLNIFTLLTVLGLIIYRIKKPKAERPYKVIFYPVVPIIFVLINIWIAVYGLMFKPVESFAGLGITLLGLFFYFIGKKASERS